MSPNPVLAPLAVSVLGRHCRAWVLVLPCPTSVLLHLLLSCLPTLSLHLLTDPLVGPELGDGGGGIIPSTEVPSSLSAFILWTRSQELPVVLGCTLQGVSGPELVWLGVCCCLCLAALGEESAWLGGHSHF